MIRLLVVYERRWLIWHHLDTMKCILYRNVQIMIHWVVVGSFLPRDNIEYELMFHVRFSEDWGTNSPPTSYCIYQGKYKSKLRGSYLAKLKSSAPQSHLH